MPNKDYVNYHHKLLLLSQIVAVGYAVYSLQLRKEIWTLSWSYLFFNVMHFFIFTPLEPFHLGINWAYCKWNQSSASSGEGSCSSWFWCEETLYSSSTGRRWSFPLFIHSSPLDLQRMRPGHQLPCPALNVAPSLWCFSPFHFTHWDVVFVCVWGDWAHTPILWLLSELHLLTVTSAAAVIHCVCSWASVGRLLMLGFPLQPDAARLRMGLHRSTLGSYKWMETGFSQHSSEGSVFFHLP